MLFFFSILCNCNFNFKKWYLKYICSSLYVEFPRISDNLSKSNEVYYSVVENDSFSYRGSRSAQLVSESKINKFVFIAFPKFRF